MTKKYRKKPVVIEAMIFSGTVESTDEVLAFMDRGGGSWQAYSNGSLIIPTLEGDHEASPGDYIIKGVKGEFYPCKPDIFEMTYEEVDDGQTD